MSTNQASGREEKKTNKKNRKRKTYWWRWSQSLNNQYFVTDIDECTIGQSDCSPFAYCVDTEGSFLCHCNEGYTGDGIDCTGK